MRGPLGIGHGRHMDVTPGVPSGASQASPGCRSSILLHLNPFSLYDPRKPCAQGTFVWGIVYPILIAFLIYVVVMVFIFVLAGRAGEDPSELLDRAAFAAMVSSVLTVARLLLSPLIIIRRTNDLGWTPAIAAIWLVFALLTLWSGIPVVPVVGGFAQLLIVVILAVVPGRTARVRRST
jgi:hypothetical protein